MPVKSKDADQLVELDDDPRRQLVERIVASPSFAKSERLSSFLTCVCELARTGKLENINEQYIGATVFGRSPGYDPGADSIVRSHASRLRQRLQQYFAEEGSDEELLLTIPKGSYVPIFEPRNVPVTQPRALRSLSLADHDVVANTEPAGEKTDTALTKDNRWIIPLALVLLSISLFAVAVIGAMLFVEHRHARPATLSKSESVRLFWENFFNGNQKTIVINADSGLVMLQNLTKRRISLAAYLSGDYLKHLPPSAYPQDQTINLGTRRYTSVVDLSIMNRLFRMPGLSLERTQFRYARDMRMDEIKQGNLVLLGTYESTPWVQLFEPSMNFYFQNDLASGVFSVINRNPQKNEQSKYDSLANDPEHTVYGLVAYRPTLSGSGKVLILEGQSMAGTETASDFVFDDGYLLPFLQSIRRPDGSIPYFELLLRSKSISVEASRLEPVAFRVESH